MADDMSTVDAKFVHHFVVEQGRIDDVVDLIAAGRFAEARQMRRDHPEVVAKLFEKRFDAQQAAGPMKEKQRLSAAAEGMEFDLELAAANWFYGLHYLPLRVSATGAALAATALPLVSVRRKLSGA